ncbi:MAG TPA: hypothetical protein VLZ09_08490, partial [Gaiellaceae bacterium]|nr:hypothetical protein [Gaiellaceae bacterium]
MILGDRSATRSAGTRPGGAGHHTPIREFSIGTFAALEKAKADKEAHGEFDSACPGYCGAQDTFYVGT